MSGENLLHAEMFNSVPLVGALTRRALAERAEETRVATEGMTDTPLSVVIRTRNNEDRLEGTFQDIANQKYDGDVQLVVVDTESTDHTADIAKSAGATIVTLSQDDFTYPKSLNLGIEVADYPNVLTLSNRTNLVSVVALKSLTRWGGVPDFAGVYGALIWDNDTTIWERSLIAALNARSNRLAPASMLTEYVSGAMVAHRSIINKEAWREMGGFDERYADGGEDTDMAKRLLTSGGIIVRDPAISVHHSHGPDMNLRRTINFVRSTWERQDGNPREFNPRFVQANRPDMG